MTKPSFLKLFLLRIAPLATIIVTASATPKTTLRVLTYNIHHGEGLDQKIDLPRLAKIIRSVSPDLVSLQEVDRNTRRSGGIDQAAELARLTGMKMIFGSSMDYQGGEYGNAVLSKWKVRKKRLLPLPGEPRSALAVTVTLPGESGVADDILFIATHLDTSAEARLASVPLIEKAFPTNQNQPAVLAGDLNATPESPAMKALLKNWQSSHAPANPPTAPAAHPTLLIDYVLVRPAARWKVLETQVLDAPVASDHRPVLAVLELQAE